MKNNFKKIISLLLIIGMNWSAISMIAGTDAYFNDTEISENNILAAGSLDFYLSGGGFNVYDFDGTTETRNIEVVNDGSLDFQHTLSVETNGSFCGDLNIAITDPETQLQYNGSLTNFISTEVGIQGVWNFVISYEGTPPSENGSCFFNFVFDGWQDNVLNYGDSGFSDTEMISNVISTSGSNPIPNPPIPDDPTPGDPNLKPNPTPDCGPADYVVINEVQIGGETAYDEFIELYNPTNLEINLENWDLKRKTSGGSESNILNNIEGIIPAYGHFLVTPRANCGDGDNENCYEGLIVADDEYTTNSFLANDNTVLLYDNNGNLIDKVGYGSAGDYETVSDLETSSYPINPSNNQSVERGLTGYDSDDNSKDFIIKETPTPTNSGGDGMPEIVINEFLASGVIYSDFIEIYNWSSFDFEAGWEITIESCGNPLVTINSFPEIVAGDWGVVTLSSNNILCESGGVITLYDNGGIEIDKISYYDADIADSSFARIPDGSPNWVDPIPTPGGTNVTPENLEMAGLEDLIEDDGGKLLSPPVINSTPAPVIPEPIVEPTNTDTDDIDDGDVEYTNDDGDSEEDAIEYADDNDDAISEDEENTDVDDTITDDTDDVDTTDDDDADTTDDIDTNDGDDGDTTDDGIITDDTETTDDDVTDDDTDNMPDDITDNTDNISDDVVKEVNESSIVNELAE